MMRRLLLTLLTLASAALPPPFTASRYYSAGKVGTLPRSPPLDVSTEEGVRELVRLRSFGPSAGPSGGVPELILFQFEAQAHHRAYQAPWLDFAVTLCWQLTHAGLHHYAAIGGVPQDCLELHATFFRLFPSLPPPACVFATPPGASVEALWAARWTVVTEVLKRGVNVLALDADTARESLLPPRLVPSALSHPPPPAVHRDPYEELHAPCLASVNLLGLQEREWEANGGFMYIRGAAPGGPVHWLLSQVARRHALFAAERAATGSWPGRVMDQIAIQNALRVAASANGSAWDFAGGGGWEPEFAAAPFWKRHPQPPPVAKGNKFAPTGSVMRPLPADCPSAAAWEARLAAQEEEGGGELPAHTLARLVAEAAPPLRPAGLIELRVPADAGEGWQGEGAGKVELLAWAPATLIRLGEWVHKGSWAAAEGEGTLQAVTHLMGTRGSWMSTRERAADDLSHSARIGVMQAHGLWPPQLSQAHAEDSGARLLFLSPRLSDLASLHDSALRLRNLIARALVAAIISNRTLVLPRVPCESAWIRKSDAAVHGIDEPRLIVMPARSGGEVSCWVGGSSGTNCWPWADFVFGFDTVAKRRQPEAKEMLWVPEAVLQERRDVELSHLPHMGEELAALSARNEWPDNERLARLQDSCLSFLEATELDPAHSDS